MFLIIILSLMVGTVWWRVRLGRRLMELKHGEMWQILATVFAGMMIVCPMVAAEVGHLFYPPIAAAGYLWHVLVLPMVVGVVLLVDLWGWGRRKRGIEPPVNVERRRFLTVAGALVPPLVTVGLSAVGESQIGVFRTREVSLSPPGLPDELDGFTIAFVADVHTGPFSNERMLAEIVQRTNTIHNGGPADLVLLGGDLINTSLRDLPEALDMATALQGKLGTFSCMGNHDVMADPVSFVRRVEDAGIPLLLDDVVTLNWKGRKFQVLGVDWRLGDLALFGSVKNVAARRDPALFPICLAHHPHSWDEAVRQGLPLVLSGHTHGGQIMLTSRIGGGPLRFRYWSGTHVRDGSTLVISNGVGNWFPLRINAPAEILKITLRTAPVTA